jgi:hypothetical protein
MRIDSLMAMCPQITAGAGFDDEGNPLTYWRLPIDSSRVIVIDTDSSGSGEVVRLFTIDFPGIVNDHGLGVASSVGDLRRYYECFHIGLNEGAVIVWPQPDEGLSFRLSVSSDSIPRVSGTSDLKEIPETTRVVGMIARRVIEMIGSCQ